MRLLCMALAKLFKHAAARLPELSESAHAQSHLDGEFYAPGGLALS